MKKRFLTFVLLLCSLAVSAQTLRVAILETVDKGGNIPYATKLMIRANLSKAITNSEGYEAYDRTDMDAIMGEQNFQRTGMVSSDQIKRLGEMTGANYILVAEAVLVDAQNVFVTAKVLDVETARTALSDNMVMGTSAKSILEGCQGLAKRMFSSPATSTITSAGPAPSVVEEPTIQSRGLELVHYSKDERRTFGMPLYSYGDMKINSDKELLRFLHNNCPEAYRRMMSGKKCKAAGWTMFSLGMAMIAGGSTMMGCSDRKEWSYHYNSTIDDYQWGYYNHFDYDMFAGGIALLTIGCFSFTPSLILIPIGHHRYNNAYQTFNKRCATTMTLNLTSSQNGIGLALCF